MHRALLASGRYGVCSFPPGTDVASLQRSDHDGERDYHVQRHLTAASRWSPHCELSSVVLMPRTKLKPWPVDQIYHVSGLVQWQKSAGAVEIAPKGRLSSTYQRMLYKFPNERLRSQVLDSAGQEQAIELRAATEGKTVAAFLVSLMGSDQGYWFSYRIHLSRILKLVSIYFEYIYILLHLFDIPHQVTLCQYSSKIELEKSSCVI